MLPVNPSNPSYSRGNSVAKSPFAVLQCNTAGCMFAALPELDEDIMCIRGEDSHSLSKQEQDCAEG